MRILVLALTLAAFISSARPAETDAVPVLRTGHPRLLVTDEQLSAAVEAAKSDPLRAALHARIVEAARLGLKAEPLARKLKSGKLLSVSRSAIGQILTGAMAYRLTGDIRFLERARKDLLTAAAFTDWNPSHFLDVAEMSLAVAVGYDWLYPGLSPGDRETIRKALDSKALSFVPAAYAPGGPTDKRLFFANARMNWNQVCNGGLLAAALAVGDLEPETLGQVIRGVRTTLPLATAAYQPDGGYPEGPAYWAYGTSYNAIILALLEGTLGTDYGLGSAPAFDRTVLYRTEVVGPTGYAFNYADGSSRVEDTPAYAWLAGRYADRAGLARCRELLRTEIEERRPDRFLALGVAWFPRDPGPVPAAEEPPLSVHFKGGADIAIFRSAWNDPGALFVGFKAGDNRTNHSHLDLGSFVLEADGVRWAIDLGPDDYSLPGYFGDGRWQYFRLVNRSHNTVTPADVLQDPRATAPITVFSDAADRPLAVADLTAAYPRAARRILRGIALPGLSRVLVQDDFQQLSSGTPVRWVMMTASRTDLSGDRRSAVLTQSGRQLRAVILSPEGAAFKVEDARPHTFMEAQNTGDSILAIEIAASPAARDLRVAVLLQPVGGRWREGPAPKLEDVSSWR
jgi:hypothetical protein